MLKQLFYLALWVFAWSGVSSSRSVLDIFGSSLSPDFNVPIEMAERMDEVPLCRTEYRWVNLSKAETIDGKPVTLRKGYGSIVGGRKKQSQWFYVAYCSREKQPCSHVNENTETMCKTQYGVTVALVETENGEIAFDDIQVPTACVCVAKVAKKRSEKLNKTPLEDFFLNGFS